MFTAEHLDCQYFKLFSVSHFLRHCDSLNDSLENWENLPFWAGLKNKKGRKTKFYSLLDDLVS